MWWSLTQLEGDHSIGGNHSIGEEIKDNSVHHGLSQNKKNIFIKNYHEEKNYQDNYQDN